MLNVLVVHLDIILMNLLHAQNVVSLTVHNVMDLQLVVNAMMDFIKLC